jgi:hypothetical protein
MRTTEDVEERMSGPDLALMTLVYDLLMKRDRERQEAMIKHAVWSE